MNAVNCFGYEISS